MKHVSMADAEKLGQRLTEQTQELKELYLQETKKWAIKEFAFISKKAVLPIEDWYKEYKVETYMQKSLYGCVIRDDAYNRLDDETKAKVKEYLSPDSKEYGKRKTNCSLYRNG